MEYYVIREDINRHKLEYYNIFNNGYVYDDVNEFKKEYKENKDRDKLIEVLDRVFKYAFWAKAEHEVIVSPLIKSKFEEHNFEKKIDIYYQLQPNIPVIADMLIYEWSKDDN